MSLREAILCEFVIGAQEAILCGVVLVLVLEGDALASDRDCIPMI